MSNGLRMRVARGSKDSHKLAGQKMPIKVKGDLEPEKTGRPAEDAEGSRSAALVFGALLVGPAAAAVTGGAAGELENPVMLLRGLATVAAGILGWGMLSIPDGRLRYPSPVLWRAVRAFAIVNLALLWLGLWASPEQARGALAVLDPSLGEPLVEELYAADCSVWSPATGFSNVIAKLDSFVISHSLGWFFKAWLLRDPVLMMAMSVTWEGFEMAFAYVLPNFAECWWDSWVLDFGSNTAGILAGVWVVNRLNWTPYNFVGVPLGPNGRPDWTNHAFRPWTWSMWSSPSQAGWSLVVFFFTMVFEGNAFFLKHLLWIPVTNLLNHTRIILGILSYAPAVHAIGGFLVQNKPLARIDRAGILIAFTVVFSEILLVLKLSQSIFPQSHPTWVAYHTIAMAVVVVFLMLTSKWRL